MASFVRTFGSFRWLLGFLFVLALMNLAAPAYAQTIATGQIEGVVKDPTGAVIPGVRVVVRNLATSAERELFTNEVGRYRAVNLAPGEYELTVEQSGFATVKRGGIVVEVGSTATVNVTLEVAAAGEIITVTEGAAIIEPERTEYTAIVSELSVANLPINGRRWDRFMLLT
ncbi:carboxypeptidase-like regulatory domain-containing protein, partial [Acidobacteriia bacterium AH_259_A11_L15]|nr:carboxypeptidase-like regulatory domain-containing protein [Acidobacteriia bacterium AH_259_A11_L15]